MSQANFNNITPTISLSTAQTVPLLLASVALEELALAHLLNSEAEKLQFVLGTLTPARTTFSPAVVSLSNLFTLNNSVQRTLRDVIKKEMLLEFKFENTLDLISTLVPSPGPRFTRIFAAGGGFFGVNTNQTDVYSCLTDTWTTLAPMSIPREGHAAALLPDGRVIVSHGESQNIGDTNTVEIYDPVSNTWSAGPNAPVINAELMGTLLNGKYYVVGGRDNFSSVQIFDPTTSTWSLGPSLPTPRAGLAVVELNGLLHAIGGRNGTEPRSGSAFVTHEVFDPTTNTWTTRAPLPLPRMDIYSTVAFDGKIYVIGGFDGSTTVNTVFIYDPATDTWTTGAPMPTARSNAGAAVCGDEIFVMGGVLEGSFTPLTTVEAYNPATNTWRTNVAPMPIGRAEFTGVSLL